jgi:two-component system sensor histidine kinase BaeS
LLPVRLSTKLFVMLTTASLLVALASSIAARLSFKTGFLGYLNEQSIEQLRETADRLQTDYAKQGDWEWLRGNMPKWMAMTRFPSATPNYSLPPSDALMIGVYSRMAVFDNDRHRVVGNPATHPDMPSVPVLWNGTVVGTVAILPVERVTGPANIRFERQQYNADELIGIGSVFMLALASILLSRWLASPLLRVVAAIHTLTKGDFTPRLEESSRDEFGKLATDFNELAQTLQRNEMTRRSFVADISHELRTPLAVLRAELEAIEDGVRAPNRETIQSLAAEVATMSELVTDLYDLSLSDVGALAFKKVNVDAAEILRLTVCAFRERLADRDLKVEAHIPEHTPLIEADEGRLHQLFNNVLENSARYTNPGGKIRLRVSFDAGFLTIDCEDSAPGLTEEQISKLFQRFYRADPSRNRATGGAGLGLAICVGIVEAHGGQIEARHSLLGGIWIHITLPRAALSRTQLAYSH